MGKLIGTLLFLTGLALLVFGLYVPPVLLPQSTWQVVWHSGLGFFLCVIGYVMASYSGAEGLLKFFSSLLMLLGFGLILLGIFPTLLGVPLYPGAGNTVRWLLGVFFCLGAWGLGELGNLAI
ncbi:MAG: hypothetical protein ACUVXH_13640 [Anaerolineae bacterium]